MADYGFPLLFALGLWWFSTGVVLYLDNLPGRTFRWTLMGGSVVLAIAIFVLIVSSASTSVAGAYVAFTAGVVIWGVIEMSYFTGLITGPRKTACPPGCSKWKRFGLAILTSLYHELLILGTVLFMVLATWGEPNKVGTWTFVVLWIMRWSAKLNLFLGVPNLNEDWLPEPLRYLKTYMVKRAMNLLFPVSVTLATIVDVLIVLEALSPEVALDPSVFLNDPRVRAALHAPLSKNWTQSFTYPFGNVYLNNTPNRHGDLSIEPAVFLTPLFANASAKRIPWVFYSGNDDSLVQHRGTEVIIQNMTFGGQQGFTHKPATPWFDDDGAFAGIVHQERGLAYVLFQGAGHLVPMWKPAQALVFLREFVLGDNLNGTVSGTVVVGGENATLANDFLPGGDVIFYGSSATQYTLTVPAASQSAWSAFIATATATKSPLQHGINGASGGWLDGTMLAAIWGTTAVLWTVLF